MIDFDWGVNKWSWWLMPNLTVYHLGRSWIITIGWLPFYAEWSFDEYIIPPLTSTPE